MNVFVYNVKRTWHYMQRSGVRKTFRKLGEKTGLIASEYHRWFLEHKVTEEQLARQKRRVFAEKYKFSFIVPAYKTPEVYLRELIDSLRRQSYGNWELCIGDGSGADDCVKRVALSYNDQRIKYKKLEKNLGISGNTNEALKMAEGDFIGLVDHDDLLEPDALYYVMDVLERRPDTDVVYTDEGKIMMNGKRYFDSHFKPDFNLWLLRSNNYICHLFFARKSLVEQVGGFRSAYDGAQDYDFILRCCEQAKAIEHIPRILYHWRAHPGSTAGNPASKLYAYEAGAKAVADHYRRMGIEGATEYTGLPGRYHTRIAVQGAPKVCIVVSDVGTEKDLDECLKSIEAGTAYSNYEICVITKRRALRRNEKAEVIQAQGELCSEKNRLGIGRDSDYLVFLDSVNKIISEKWLEEMLGICQQEQVGIVGTKILFANGYVKSAGIILGLWGVAGDVACGETQGDDGYAGRNISVMELSAVNGSCMMTSREVFRKLRGFSGEYGDYLGAVDYALRAKTEGLQTVYNPYAAVLFQGKWKCRRKDEAAYNTAEMERFKKRWGEKLKAGDPCYSPNLTLNASNYSIREK